MARGDAETRNKRKVKFRDKKKHPYKTGGRRRSMNLSGSSKKEKERGKSK